MRILIVNDDGLACEGLHKLKSLLEQQHEVWVVVPDRNRSGISHGITMYEPLSIQKIEERVYTCSGLPVDCCCNGIRGIVSGDVHVVLSGINKGANLGTDVLYSGTAAGARQASLLGIPGIAISVSDKNDEGSWVYDGLARFIAENLEKLVSLWEEGVFLNINAMSLEKYKGVRLTDLSIRDYNDAVELHNVSDGKIFSFFVGGTISSEGKKGSPMPVDFATVDQGYISISKVLAQPVAVERWENEECFSQWDFSL